jgi:hypothetical protein
MKMSKNDAVNGPGVNSPAGFLRLSEAEQDCLLGWIALAIRPAATRGRLSSYGLKHAFEALGGFYVTNGEFKGAMCAAGYTALDERELNWWYRVKPTRDNHGSTYWEWSEAVHGGYGIDQAEAWEQARYLLLRERCNAIRRCGAISLETWRHIFGEDEDEMGRAC